MFFKVSADMLPIRSSLQAIEAETFANMSGIQMEPGGFAVGWFDDGDWMRYGRVDFQSGAASVTFSVAKQSVGGTVEMRIGSPDGRLIGRLIPENTGGWASYEMQSVNLLDTVTGIQDLYLVGVGAQGVCNIDWIRFSAEPVYIPDYQLVWSDEFEGSSLDTSKWRAVQHGDVDNGELQFYTTRPENVRVESGELVLTALREDYTGTGPWMSGSKTVEYTSGKIESVGRASFRYGKFEARIKMPRGAGTWPAFWMLGDNIFDPNVGWPLCGEIDIMEHAHVLDAIGAAIHTGSYNHSIGTQKTGGYAISDYDTEYHIYGVEWTAEKLSFYVDNDIYFTVTKEALGSSQAEWPFDQPFWMILNLAVGGAWGGDPSGGDYPYSMSVDWVRVYQDANQ